MAEEVDIGCARPTGGPVGESVPDKEEPVVEAIFSKEEATMIQVGEKKCPILPPRAINKASSYRLNYPITWAIGCCCAFYPGDFTFV